MISMSYENFTRRARTGTAADRDASDGQRTRPVIGQGYALRRAGSIGGLVAECQAGRDKVYRRHDADAAETD